MPTPRMPRPAVRLIAAAAFGALAGFLVSARGPPAAAGEPPASLAASILPLLAAARTLDLTYPIDEHTPCWPESAAPFTSETLSTIEKDGYFSKAFRMREHYGTHMDAPSHFVARHQSVDEIAPDRLHGEAIVMDISARAATDPDAMLESADIAAFEKQHGSVPAGAIVLLRTGWSARAADRNTYMNCDKEGRLRFPGFGPEAARLLVERGAKGIGIDTLSIDRGLSQSFEVHHIALQAGLFALENLNDAIRDLPPRGAFLVALPLKLRGGSGGPVRIVAFVPR